VQNQKKDLMTDLNVEVIQDQVLVDEHLAHMVEEEETGEIEVVTEAKDQLQDDMHDAHQETAQDLHAQDLGVAQVEETVEIQKEMGMRKENLDQKEHLVVVDKNTMIC
jgi:DNA-binding NarL/FixJ family response regulator